MINHISSNLGGGSGKLVQKLSQECEGSFTVNIQMSSERINAGFLSTEGSYTVNIQMSSVRIDVGYLSAEGSYSVNIQMSSVRIDVGYLTLQYVTYQHVKVYAKT